MLASNALAAWRLAPVLALLGLVLIAAAPAWAAPGFTGATRFEATGDLSVRSIVALPDGGALVGGTFRVTATFGEGISLTSAGGYDGFVARRNADGTYAWARRFGDTPGDGVSAVAVASDGSPLVVGTLNQGPVVTTFIAKLTANGDVVWSRDVWSASTSNSLATAAGSGIVALADGGLVVVGTAAADTGTYFGSRPTVALQVVPKDLWVTRLDSAGTFLWATGYSGQSPFTADAVEVLPGERLALGGGSPAPRRSVGGSR